MKAPPFRNAMVGELLLGGALHPRHAGQIGLELERIYARYLIHAKLQAAARAQSKRKGRGRPNDVAERQFEAEILEILELYGIRSQRRGGVGASIIALLLGTVSADPRNARRRASKRLSSLRRLRKSLGA